MAKFIFIRHGESELNQEKKFFGWLNPHLTEKGRNQAKNIIEKIPEYDFIFSSPLNRTLETANIINKLNKEIIVDEKLKEINFGDFEGLSYEEIKLKFPIEVENWLKMSYEYKFPNGESPLELIDRCKIFIDTHKNSNGTFLIITHFGIINAILCSYISENIKSFWKFKPHFASITTLEYINEYFSLVNFNVD